MKLIFISGALPNSILQDYDKKYAKKPKRYVQQWWDYSLAEQLKEVCGAENFFAISFPPVSTFPTSKCFFHKKREIKTEEGINIFLPRMWNLAGIRHLNLISSIYKKIRFFAKRFKEEQIVVLTNCIYLQSAIPANKAKKFNNVKICSIVPDLPEHATGQALTGNSMLKKLYGVYTKWTLPYKYKFDGYICFAKPQMEHLNKERPYMIMEGFMDCTMFDDKEKLEFSKHRIVYGGGLAYRYGIKELIDGFINANLGNAELWLYGNGDAEDYIKDKEDKGVFYGGTVSREQMLQIEKSATLLVNPRPTTEEYSKCSFPSKLMEYMASGTPVLTSKLACIEEEYFDKLNFIDEVSIEGVSKALIDVWANLEQAKIKAEKASAYIREYKNVKYQAERVCRFLQTEL